MFNNTTCHYSVAKAVTPHASNENAYTGFMVTVAGNVEIIDTQGNTTVIPALAGVVYNISTTKILAANTTATGIIGLI